jgi:hypothetical protein
MAPASCWRNYWPDGLLASCQEIHLPQQIGRNKLLATSGLRQISHKKLLATAKCWAKVNKKLRASEGIRTPGWRHHKPLP